MGIDIYARWKGYTEEDQEKQYTGFSTTAGDVGYLREAYHGGPYATKVLVPEAFEADGNGGVPIPAATLRERLPAAVITTLLREATLYKDTSCRAWLSANLLMEAKVEDLEDAKSVDEAVRRIFTKEVPAVERPQGTENTTMTTTLLDEACEKFPTAKAYKDFVELCERKEAETGMPCTIEASY